MSESETAAHTIAISASVENLETAKPYEADLRDSEYGVRRELWIGLIFQQHKKEENNNGNSN